MSAFGVYYVATANTLRGGILQQYKQIWNGKVSGYTTHTFNTAFTQLTTNFVDTTGATLHSFTVDKAGKLVGPPSPVDPGPAPAPPGAR